MQNRQYSEFYKTEGKVTFRNIGYKGVYRVKLNDGILGRDLELIATELTSKYNCNLVISPYPEVKNPDSKSGLIYIRDATDDAVIEMSKDERIKFIAQHYPDH